ncbi:MAG: hypothetical protein ABW122_01380, partial [Ilumatobacteraceae bacterium]
MLVAVRDLATHAIDQLRSLAAEPGRPIVVVTSTTPDEWRDGELLTVVECGVVAILGRAEVTAER